MKLLNNLWLKFKKILLVDILCRVVFTCINFFKYHKDLKKCLVFSTLKQNQGLNIDFGIDKIVSLDPIALKEAKIEALILDYDGVLSHHGEMQPLSEVLVWLEQAIEVFGAGNIFIWSNNPKLARKDFLDIYFAKKIIFVISKPKPYLDGIVYINNCLKSNNNGRSIMKENILLIDDRVGTGILAAKMFGVASCLILDPYIKIKQNFFVETLFIVIRRLERLLIWHLS